MFLITCRLFTLFCLGYDDFYSSRFFFSLFFFFLCLQYLEDNRDKVYVDIDEMVTELQRKYRDYNKKKRSAFKGLVEKGMYIIPNYNLESQRRELKINYT